MTRFARAKGSKSSNERICEEATSWKEMKEQILEKKKEIEDEEKRKKVEEMRNTNYQNFLKDKEKLIENQSVWADFPNASENINNKSNSIGKPLDKTSRRKKRKITATAENDMDSGIEVQCNVIDDINIKRKKVKKSHDKNENPSIENDAPLEISSKVEVTKPEVKKCKSKKKKLSIVLDQKKLVPVEVESGQNEVKSKKEIVNAKSNSNNQMHKLIDIDSLTEVEKRKIQKKQERRKRQIEKKKLKKQQKRENIKLEDSEQSKLTGKSTEDLIDNSNDLKEKSEKFLDKSDTLKLKKNNKNVKNTLKKEKLKNGDFKRRKDFQPNKMLINGKEVNISYFDGFPIKKEDAENLKILRKEMISKGLPRSEINRTLKLERRKAEKALTREKKNVCFNCRKFGHNLSECPELTNKDSGELIDSTGTGICFKCGSTEHTSFACRVVQGANFKFATCFICKEQGHISRQCPDNARGLYPKGGSCKTCGDVTHLKKDCPKFRIIQEKEHDKFQVEAISTGNPEDINEGNSYVGEKSSRPNKIVKF